MTGRTDSRLQRAKTTSGSTELLARDISSAMRYTVDPRVGPPKKNRSAKGRQQDRCHDEGQRTRPRTNAIRPPRGLMVGWSPGVSIRAGPAVQGTVQSSTTDRRTPLVGLGSIPPGEGQLDP